MSEWLDSAYDCIDDDEEYEDEWDDSRESDECCFPPGECLMPGEHLAVECYNLEMAEAWAEEYHRDRPQSR
jgi:hypothetical protein